MTHLLYSLIIFYLLSVILSYPWVKKTVIKEFGDEITFFSLPFMARAISLIPFYNLYFGATSFLDWLVLKVLIWRLKRVSKKHGDQKHGDQEKLKEVVTALTKYNDQ